MIGDVGFSNEFWLGLAMAAVLPFLVGFIPVFYLSFLFFKTKDVNILITLLVSFSISLFIAISIQDYILSFFSSLKLIHEAAPLITLPSFSILEIIIVLIHFLKQQKKQKIQKRSRKKS